MSGWTLTQRRAKFLQGTITTERGIENPLTHEVLVAVSHMYSKRRALLEGPVANLCLEDGTFLLSEDPADEPTFIALD